MRAIGRPVDVVIFNVVVDTAILAFPLGLEIIGVASASAIAKFFAST